MMEDGRISRLAAKSVATGVLYHGMMVHPAIRYALACIRSIWVFLRVIRRAPKTNIQENNLQTRLPDLNWQGKPYTYLNCLACHGRILPGENLIFMPRRHVLHPGTCAEKVVSGEGQCPKYCREHDERTLVLFDLYE